MKKLVIFLLLLVGIFLAGTVFATEWYTVQVTGGSVDADRNGNVVLPVPIPAGPVVNLDPLAAPYTTVTGIQQLAAAALPIAPTADGWNAAGWWEFQVNQSSGGGWNNVFGGGNYTFTSDWLGPIGPIHFADINMTFNDIYGKWSRNNASVWTYFGLYVAPNTPAAQLQGPPIGIFAFVADDPLLYPPEGFPNLNPLYAVTLNNPLAIQGGTGRFEAVPEPATMLLLGLGLMGIAGIRRKFKG